MARRISSLLFDVLVVVWDDDVLSLSWTMVLFFEGSSVVFHTTCSFQRSPRSWISFSRRMTPSFFKACVKIGFKTRGKISKNGKKIKKKLLEFLEILSVFFFLEFLAIFKSIFC